jgi:hypothetical protein
MRWAVGCVECVMEKIKLRKPDFNWKIESDILGVCSVREEGKSYNCKDLLLFFLPFPRHKHKKGNQFSHFMILWKNNEFSARVKRNKIPSSHMSVTHECSEENMLKGMTDSLKRDNFMFVHVLYADDFLN